MFFNLSTSDLLSELVDIRLFFTCNFECLFELVVDITNVFKGNSSILNPCFASLIVIMLVLIGFISLVESTLVVKGNSMLTSLVESGLVGDTHFGICMI